MSLTSALNIATSGMRATQTAISVTSSNIANADVDGYTRKSVTSQTVVVSGVSSGVSLSEVQRQVDAGLERRTNAARSQSGSAEVLADYLSQLSNAMGSTTGDDTIASAITDLATSLQSLSLAPDGASEAQLVVSDIEDLVDRANSLTGSIQDLRGDADKAIGDSVDAVNASLQRLDDLNEQVQRAQASGVSTADLVDKQMQEVAILSTQLSVTYFTDSTGAMSIYGPGGTILLDDTVHELDFTAAASVDSTSSYSASGTLSGITVGGKDLTSFINSGTIGGLLDIRDEVLPAQQAIVDALTDSVMTALNEAQNGGTSLPPPSSLTSSGTVDGSQALDGSGTLRIAVLDDVGVVQSFTDLDLSSYATIDDLVAAIDGMAGLTAGIDADGKLSIVSEDSSLGIGLAQVSGGIGTDVVSASAALGLNDLVSKSSSGHLTLRGDVAADPSLLARGTLSVESGLAAGDTGIASGDISTLTALIAGFTGTQSFAATGGLSAVDTTLAGYAGELISHVAVLGSEADATSAIKASALSNLASSLANGSGVNLDEEAAELEILQTNYQAAANVISVIQEMYDVLLNMV
nr:flagellar hook-associated protein FlgK [uncultured Dongia sp.]